MFNDQTRNSESLNDKTLPRKSRYHKYCTGSLYPPPPKKKHYSTQYDLFGPNTVNPAPTTLLLKLAFGGSAFSA